MENKRERRHKIEDIDLQIESVEPFVNDNHTGLIISWSSNIGFGEYTFYRDSKDKNSEWKIDSETMDCGEDKDFGRALLKLWIDKCVVR